MNSERSSAKGWKPILFSVWIAAWLASGGGTSGANAPLVRSLGPLVKPMDASERAVLRPKSRVLAGQGEIQEWIRLEAPKESEYRAADEEGLRKGVRIIGLVRELPQPYASGTAKTSSWTITADGVRVWAIVIESPTATGIRLGLDEVALPDGATLRVASMMDPAHVAGPYGPSTLIPGERFWTETVFDQAVVLECQMPIEAEEKAFSVAIVKIAHLYEPFDNLVVPKVGDCHNDVTCADSGWRSIGNSVAGIGTIGESGVIWCTGALLNNAAQDQTDYFLTAYHCVENQSQADSTEYYWFYQTATCNGSPPSPSSVPRTGQGAVFLQGRNEDVGSDFAFLRLRRSTPGGVVYSGWSASHPGNSAPVTGIHHPDGSFKRISYGTLRGEDSQYWTIRWSSGVTEPGSSGSPLFNSSREVIGQLYGGAASCNFPTGRDYYGRFNATYEWISPWLAPGHTLWDAGYQSLGNGWRRVGWFGDYIPMGSAGWIWHNKHGFFFVAANSTPQSIWLFAQDMGWLWTSSSRYPFLYRSRDRAWLWYNGARNPRWFRNMATSRWERWP